MKNIKVIPVPKETVNPWLLTHHYLKRLCPISWSFGVYDGSEMIGCITFGYPYSSSLRQGICGDYWAGSVVELNRLVLGCNRHNLASRVIAMSIKQLPKPKIIVSFSEIEMGHTGFVYQASNFYYTGLSAKRTDWKIRGLEHLHGGTVADTSRRKNGEMSRVEFMRQKYGDNFYLENRPRKHRYVYFHGSKKDKRDMLKSLNYLIEPYPKQPSQRYDVPEKTDSQMLLI